MRTDHRSMLIDRINRELRVLKLIEHKPLPDVEEVGGVKLHLGQLNFLPPPKFLEAVKEVINDTLTRSRQKAATKVPEHRYLEEEAGLPKAREQVVEKWLKPMGIPCDVSNVLITGGAQLAFYTAVRAFLSKCDRALVVAPFYPYHWNAVALATGDPDSIEVVTSRIEDGYQLPVGQIESAVKDRDKRIKLIIICNPSNPTGTLYERERLERLRDLVVENNLLVLSDEAYSFFVYDNRQYVSVASLEGMRGHAMVAGTLSKIYGITGWRFGFLALIDHLASEKEGMKERAFKHVKALCDCECIHSTTLTQYIVARALEKEGQDGTETFAHLKGSDGWITKLQKRRDEIIEILKAVDLEVDVPPQGAYYLFPRIGAEFQEKLKRFRPSRATLKMYEVENWERLSLANKAVLFLANQARAGCKPGDIFGRAQQYRRYVRFAFGDVEIADIERARRQIERAWSKIP
jgi:aspartate aminotransferase